MRLGVSITLGLWGEQPILEAQGFLEESGKLRGQVNARFWGATPLTLGALPEGPTSSQHYSGDRDHLGDTSHVENNLAGGEGRELWNL